MSKIVMYMASNELMREMYFLKEDKALEVYAERFSEYIPAPAFEAEKSGKDAAEEAFDLTNNPYRQDEREEVYGRGRSLSVGDIVEVTEGDDVSRFMCLSFGWMNLPA